MTVINTNINAMYAQDSTAMVSRSLSTTMERLSTGSRINSAADDAAGLAISTRMTAQSNGLNVAIRNANDGISLLQTSDGAAGEVTTILQRMRELAVQSANGVNNTTDRKSMDAEVQQLKTEIDRVATTTQFNNMNLLDGSFTNKTLQIGDNAGQTMNVNIASLQTKDLGMAGASFGSQTLVSGRVALGSAIAAGNIQINDQNVGAISANADIGQVATAINQNVDNVTATAFNDVVAQQTGNGVTTNGQIQITVQNLGGSTKSTTYSINASANMQQLVDNINSQAGGQVTASINTDGKLELSNTTGAAITVRDTSSSVTGSYDTASGFAAGTTGTQFNGFLKLDSSNGSPIRLSPGNLGASTPGTTANLNAIGFQQVTSEYSKGLNAYTVTGVAFTSAATTASWGQSDLNINGVQIYNQNIASNSFQGKLDMINNYSAQTGVVANAQFDKTVSVNPATSLAAGTTIKFNGTTVFSAGTAGMYTAASIAASINTNSTLTGITAEVDGNNIHLSGSNVQQLTISALASPGATSNLSNLSFPGTWAGTSYGAISLKSVNNSPISIQTKDGSTAEQAVTGFLDENVGAADFDVNKPTLGVGSGSTLTGLNVLTSAAASAAITTIDNALDKVNTVRSNLGAMENRLNDTVDNLSNIVTNTDAAQSRIMDTDYASETSALAKEQIISQAATAMLAQANQQPQLVLSLLK